MTYIGQGLLGVGLFAAGMASFWTPKHALRLWLSTLGAALFSALCILFYAHVTSDFHFLGVVQNTHVSMPLHLKIGSLWGYAEGSFLLWTCCLTFWLIFSGCIKKWLDAPAIRIGSAVALVHVLILLLASDPFISSLDINALGDDLNPSLQDPSLLVHPPILYAGLTLWIIPFCMALSAALGKGKTALDPLRWAVLKWSSTALTFLITLGLTLGSIWAYYELGWGGFWFWDPVESLALIPWLVGIGLIHSLKRQTTPALTKSVVGFSLLGFCSVMGGTFLTRSGILVSVHSFAQDIHKGILLGLLTLALSGVSFLAWRGCEYERHNRDSPLRTTSHVMLWAVGLVFSGVIIPLLAKALHYNIGLDETYFNSVLLPLVFIIALALSRYSKPLTWQTLWQFKPTELFCFSAGCAGVLVYYYASVHPHPLGYVGIFAGFWIVASQLQWHKLNLPARLAHGGFGLLLIGVCLTKSLSWSELSPLEPNKPMKVHGFTLTLKTPEIINYPTYTANVFPIELNGKLLKPEERFYRAMETRHMEVAIDMSPLSHTHIALAGKTEAGAIVVMVTRHRLINLVWLGALLIATSLMLSLVRSKRGEDVRP